MLDSSIAANETENSSDARLAIENDRTRSIARSMTG